MGIVFWCASGVRRGRGAGSPVEEPQTHRDELSSLLSAGTIPTSGKANLCVVYDGALRVRNTTVEIHARVQCGVEILAQHPRSNCLESGQEFVHSAREGFAIGVGVATFKLAKRST